MTKQILIIEDSKIEQQLLSGFLKKEYDVVCASGGAEGLSILTRDHKTIAAVLLDLIMPVMDGFQVLEKIRSNVLFSDIPVIITSEMKDKASQKKALTLGANTYVTKPYDQELLLMIVRNTIHLCEMTAISNAAFRDKLTGLYNREAFFVESEKMIRAQKPGYYVLAYLDIEQFKVINDQNGHDIGDQVLMHVASALEKSAVATGGISARLNSDRFAILYPVDMRDSDHIASSHEEAMHTPYLTQPISLHVGRYLVDDLTLSVEAMCDRAILAENSIQGKYGVYVAEYNAAMRDQLIYEQEIVMNMEEALRTKQFEVWFQPQYNHSNGMLMGAEALVRWRQPGKGLIPPYNFIPIFEKNGFIYELDKFVWEETCRCLKKWKEAGYEPLPVSVNISRTDIFRDDFLDIINGLVKKYELPIDLLRLEVTESAFAEDSDRIVDMVKQLISLGFTVEIDDFGSGYSSLNALKDVPAQILKLDMKFFENGDNSQRGGNIIESVVRMAKWLGMAVIAEGVEDKEQADYLHSIGCNYIQGYYYAKPMPLKDFEKLLKSSKKEAKLEALETVKELNNNAFWDPKSMETLIFNSYVGGACIFEMHNGVSYLLRANDRYAQEMGDFFFESDVIADQDLTNYLDEENAQLLTDNIERAISSHADATCELMLTDKEDPENKAYIRTTFRLIARTNDRFLFYCVIQNITEQRNAERQAVESSEQLRTIMSNINGGVSAVILNEENRIQFIICNDRYHEMFGYTKKEVEETNFDVMTLILPEDREMVLERVKQLLKDRVPTLINYRCKKRDGSLMYVQVNASLTSMEGYGDDVITSVVTDISLQKQIEDQLETIIAYVNGGIVASVQQDGGVSYILTNDQYYKMYGYTREQFTAEVSDEYQLIVPADRERIRDIYARSVSEGLPFSIEFSVTRRDGSICRVRSNVSMVELFGYNEPVQLSILNDISKEYEAKQRERELALQMRTIIGNINGGVTASRLMENNQIELVYANDGFYEIYGYTKEQFESELSNAVDLIYPEDLEKTMAVVAKLVREHGSAAYEYRCVKRDGSLMWTHCRNSVVSLDGSDDLLLIAVVTNVTEAKTAEQKQRELTSQLNLVLDNISSAVSVATIDGTKVQYLYSNKRYFELVGYSEKEYFEKFMDSFGPMFPKDRARVIKQVAQAIQSGEEARFDYRIIRGDGQIRWLRHRIISTEVDGFSGKVQFSVLDDITDTKAAETEISQAYDKLDSVMDHVDCGVLAYTSTDKDAELVFANKRFFEIIGHTREKYREIVAQDLFLPVHPEDREYTRRIVSSANTRQNNTTLQFRLIRSDQSIIWIRLVINTIRMAGINKPVQVGMFTDITAEKNADDQLHFLNDSAHDILTQPDVEPAIDSTLGKLTDYFGGDRTYIIEFDQAKGVSNNTYEFCKDGISSVMELLRDTPLEKTEVWQKKLQENRFVIIPDVERLDEKQSELREALLGQDIHSLIVAPLWRDGELCGFIEMDNPRKAIDQVQQLRALADYISILLTRRDMNRKIEADHNVILTLMNDTPGGFCRMKVRPDAAPTLEYVNAGLCKMLGMSSRQMLRAYGDNAYGFLSMEDFQQASADSAGVMHDNGEFSTRCRLLRKDGSWLWTMVFGRFNQADDGQLYLSSYFSDITEKVSEEEKQKELLDNLPYGAAMYTYNGKKLSVTHLNRKYWELVGREAMGTSDISVFDAIHPDDRAVVAQEIEMAVRQRRNAETDIRILCGDQTYKPFHIVANITAETDKTYTLFAAHTPIRDETMSFQAMLPIALSTLMSASEDISYIKDKDLRYISCSRSMAEQFGLANAEEAIGKTDHDLIKSSTADSFALFDKKVLGSGRSIVNIREKVINKDGRICHTITSKYPLFDSSGDVIGIYGTSRDTTKERERDSQLKLLTDSIPGGLASYSIKKGSIKTLYFNDGYYSFSGYSRDEYLALIEKDPLALVYDEDRDAVLAIVRSINKDTKDGDLNSCSFRCHTKDGGCRWLSLKTIVAKVAEGEHVLNVVQFDITDRVDAEGQQNELMDNLPCGAATYEYDGETLRCKYFNRRYIELVSRNNEKLEYMNPMNAVHPDDRKAVMDELADAIANDRDGSCDLRILSGDGAYKTFHLHSRISKEDDGKYTIFVAYTLIPDHELSFRETVPFILSTIMASSTDLAFVKDREFRYLCCSNTFAALLGIDDPAKVVGKTDYDLFDKDIADLFRRDDSRLIASEQPMIDIMENIPSADGTLHYIRTTKQLLRNTVGEVIGVYGSGRDETAHKLLAEKAAEQEQDLSAIITATPGGIFKYSAEDDEFVFISDTMYEMLGYTPEEFREKFHNRFSEMVWHEDREAALAKIESDIAKTGVNDSCEYRIETKSGALKWVFDAGHLITDENGRKWFVVVIVDTDEQKQAVERLRISEEENRIAMTHSSRSIGRYDVAQQTLKLSPENARRLSLPEMIEDVPYGQVKRGFISKSALETYINFYESILRGDKEGEAIFEMKHSRGWRWIKAHFTTIFSQEQEPVSAIISYEDVTEQTEKEAIFAKWQQSLESRDTDSYTLFRCDLDKDASFDSTEGNLIRFDRDTGTKLSFDECTQIYADNHVFVEDRKEYISTLNVDKLIADFHRDIRRSTLDYREMVTEDSVRWIRRSVELVEHPGSAGIMAYLLYENIDEEKKAELKTIERAETDPLTGVLNRTTFAAQVDALIKNAGTDTNQALFMLDIDNFKLINDLFGHGTGDQELIALADILRSLSRKEDLVGRLGGDEFMVFLNNIPDDKVAHERARTICEKTRKSLNEEVRLSVSIGGAICPRDGDTFEALYKKADEALYDVKYNGKDNYSFYHENLNKDHIDNDAGKAENNDIHLLKRMPHMLIVDDNEIDRDMLVNAFEDEYVIKTVSDGDAAINYLERYGHFISVVLLDLVMPGTDGFTVLEKMQGDEILRSIPVVVVSVDESRESVVRAMQNGAADFALKPFDVSALKVCVKTVIGKKPGGIEFRHDRK